MAKAALVFVCLLYLQLKTQEINAFSVKEERRSKQGTPFRVLLRLHNNLLWYGLPLPAERHGCIMHTQGKDDKMKFVEADEMFALCIVGTG